MNIIWEMSLIGVALSIFTLTIVITRKNKNQADIFLLCWLIFLNLPLIHMITTHIGIENSSFWYYTNPTLNLLYGPFLYCYVLLITREQTEFRFKYLFHLIPFAIFYVVFISFEHVGPMLPGPKHGDPLGPQAEGFLFSITAPLIHHFGLVNVISLTTYALIVALSLTKHRKKITSYFSHTDSQVSLNWIYYLPLSFILLSLANLLNESDLAFYPKISPLVLHLLCHLIFIFLLCVFGVKQKPVFKLDTPLDNSYLKLESQDSPEDIFVESALNKERSQSTPNESVANDIVHKMNDYMAVEKTYLDSSFSVYHLAEALDIPRRTLSHVLNNTLSKNFFQYVNEYRIEDVKIRLANVDDRASILDIAFESGFNSKSSFNSLFKQYCNMTPSQYRKSMDKSNLQLQQDVAEIETDLVK